MNTNKYIPYLLLSLVSTLLLSSCRSKDADIFDHSAAARFSADAKAFEEQLISQGTWVMEYYLDYDQAKGGRTIILEFGDNRAVTMSSDQHPTPQVSTYIIDAVESGSTPYMVFDSYNDVLHPMAEPSAQYVRGQGADFEFEMRYVDDHFEFIGRRFRNVMKIYPLSVERAQYISEAQQIARRLSTAVLSTISVSGAELPITLDASNRQVEITDGDTTHRIAYTITNSGLSLYEPITLMGTTIEHLDYDVVTDLLTSSDKVSSTVYRLPDAVDLTQKHMATYMYEGYISPLFANSLQQVRTAEANKYNGEYRTGYKVIIGKYDDKVGVHFVKNYGNNTIQRPTNFAVVNNLTFSAVAGHKDQISLRDLGVGLNWDWFPDVAPIKDALLQHSPYTISTEVVGGVEYTRLVSTEEPDFWFYLYDGSADYPLAPNTAWQLTLDATHASEDLVSTYGTVHSRGVTQSYVLSPTLLLGHTYSTTGFRFYYESATNASSRFNSIYQMDFVPVFGTKDAVHILKRQPGYSHSWFTFVEPIIDALAAGSPYKLTDQSGTGAKLQSIDQPASWMIIEVKK